MKHYDMHLAAAQISSSTVKKLHELGFSRDEFANLTYCHTDEFHGTFQGCNQMPYDGIWSEICCLLDGDDRFSGYVEEESIDDTWRRVLPGDGVLAVSPTLPPVSLIQCPAGRCKACDIHIGINIETSSPGAIRYMEQLKCPSVDRPSAEGVRRVYTITCEELADGEHLFLILADLLASVPGIRGRMKLEETTRHYRKPDDAVTLPLATAEAVSAWLLAIPLHNITSHPKTSLRERGTEVA